MIDTPTIHTAAVLGGIHAGRLDLDRDAEEASDLQDREERKHAGCGPADDEPGTTETASRQRTNGGNES